MLFALDNYKQHSTTNTDTIYPGNVKHSRAGEQDVHNDLMKVFVVCKRESSSTLSISKLKTCSCAFVCDVARDVYVLVEDTALVHGAFDHAANAAI